MNEAVKIQTRNTDSAEAKWAEVLRAKLELLTDRRVVIDCHNDTHQVFINFVNLPLDVWQKALGGGAEVENNRIMLTVLFPQPKNWYEKEVKDGTVRVSLSVLHIKTEKLRGKTGNPEKIAQYVADYILNIANTVPPHFTHSKRF